MDMNEDECENESPNFADITDSFTGHSRTHIPSTQQLVLRAEVVDYQILVALIVNFRLLHR